VAVVATLSKGYDLDYIWKQVDRGPAKDAASYYIQASESGGEPPGRWWGPGTKALGFDHGQRVERKPYELLFGERRAPDGTRLGRPPGNGRKAADLYAQLLAAEPHATAERRRELRTDAVKQARQSPLFFDLTISLSKSISIFHASLGENARLARQAGDHDGDEYWSALVGEVDEMIWQSVHAGFSYFQREAGYTRTGSHGTRVHGRETGQWREADLAVAHWLQHTSRDGDMQLHVHSQIAHVARTRTDGKWRAPDSLGYNEHIGAVAAVVSQHLEEALTARFGLEWTARDDGHGFEITGISGAMMRVFSSRRESITAELRGRAARFEQRYGRAPSQRELAHLAQASNFKTRNPKHGTLDLVPLPSRPWSAQVPAIADPERHAYVAEIAALMDAHKDQIGEHAAGHPPPWATAALGPVPTDPPARFDWQKRAASIGAWRELSGYDHPVDPIGPEPAAPDARAAWHEALAALGPVDGPDVRGMPDGRLLHLRDTYPVETAWAPQYVGDELRQVRAAAWDARLGGLRAAAEARAAAQRGDPGQVAVQHALAAGYQALEQAYRQRETVFTQTMADRADFDVATRVQRQLAVAADAELHRRHAGQYFPPLRSAEPEPASAAQRDGLTPTPDQPPGETDQWIKDLAAGHRTFAGRLADRHSQMIPSEDPDYGDLGPAFPAWTGPAREPILQPPKPKIPPAPRILQRMMDRDADWEATD